MKKLKKLTLRVGILLGSMITFGCAIKHAPSKYLEYQTKSDLTFPLLGESLIGTGGRTKEKNQDHIYTKDQRFAIDIIALASGASPPDTRNLVDKVLSAKLDVYNGVYNKNEDHYCFGRPVIAPGNGIVVAAIDGIIDNIPGKKNAKDAPGNHVIIDHRNGEFSMLAHLKMDSVLVKEGDKVEAEEKIGQCGNSGYSNLPHLHYHLQNTPRWHDGNGLPAQFQNYYANGKFVKRGEPIQGEIISHTQRNHEH